MKVLNSLWLTEYYQDKQAYLFKLVFVADQSSSLEVPPADKQNYVEGSDTHVFIQQEEAGCADKTRSVHVSNHSI